MYDIDMDAFRRLSGLDEGFDEYRLARQPVPKQRARRRRPRLQESFELDTSPKKRRPRHQVREHLEELQPARPKERSWTRREMQYRMNELGRMCEELAVENNRLQDECTTLRGQLAHIQRLLEGRSSGPRRRRSQEPVEDYGRMQHPTFSSGPYPRRGYQAPAGLAPDPLPGLAEVIEEESRRSVVTANSPLQHDLTPGDLAPTPGVGGDFDW